MSGKIRTGIRSQPRPATEARPQLIPMKVGNATVYVEQIGPPAEVRTEGRIRPVAPPSPEEAFETASEVLHECVRVLGERIEQLQSAISPREVTVEFSLSFEVQGAARIIPIFVTAQTKASTGLKVTAKWQCQGARES